MTPTVRAHYKERTVDDRDGDTTLGRRVTSHPPPLTATFDQYEILGQLGRGGMGVVYLARERTPIGAFRDVALKVIHPDVSQISRHHAMFLAEARVLLAVNHTNVVKVHAVGEAHGTPFIAMEYLDGVTLNTLWSTLRQLGVAWPPELAAALISQACRGLHNLHELRANDGKLRHAVHRDVSPQNLMCLPSGVVKLIDFGVVDTRELPHTNELIGKVAYMAPEQLSGARATRRSDLFSLGVVLHELLAGRRLFDGTSPMACLHHIVNHVYASPGAAPAELDAILRRTLSRDPGDRPQMAVILAEQLEEFVGKTERTLLVSENCAKLLRELGATLECPASVPLTELPWFVPKVDEGERVQLHMPAAGAAASHDLGSVRVSLMTVAAHCHAGTPYMLKLGASLPALTLLVKQSSVSLRLAEGSQARLYDDATRPESRLETLHISSGSSGRMDVGHRRTGFQTVLYSSASAEELTTGPIVRAGRLRLQLSPVQPLRQLVTICTTDSQQQLTHIAFLGVIAP
jgi:serine/threonine-protein kinase